MADNLQETGKPDDQRINVNQDHELIYWSGKFGVSRDQPRQQPLDALGGFHPDVAVVAPGAKEELPGDG